MSESWAPQWGKENHEGLPQTYPLFPRDEQIERPQLFDPALKQFARAYRVGEPTITNEIQRLRWRESRRRAMDCVLKLISNSMWREHLVLRGSILLRAWYGSAAREPGDMDWIVIPQTIRLTDPWSKLLLNGLASLITGAVPPPGIEFGREIAMDDIWTYERAPGRRMVFAWQAQGLPPGHIQMDFVFGERLLIPEAETKIPLLSGDSASVLAASRELSLAWKLVWLETDMYPQGKDLYDATLLAQQTTLRLDILKLALQDAGWRSRRPLTADFPLAWNVDWESFQIEHPWIKGTAKDWQTQLTRALEPTFSASTQ